MKCFPLSDSTCLASFINSPLATKILCVSLKEIAPNGMGSIGWMLTCTAGKGGLDGKTLNSPYGNSLQGS